MNNNIKVVTFDLWDTVFIDDSDEPERSRMGLPPKPVHRRNLVEQFLRDSGKSVPQSLIHAAYDAADAAFYQAWYQENRTWTVAERLRVLLKELKRELDSEQFNKLVILHEEMEMNPVPSLAPDISSILPVLHEKYRLAVVSDAIFSPGRCLRQILDHHKLLKYFDAFSFSDEIGCSKPCTRMFQHISDVMNVSFNEIVHIGDREQKDIAGPHAAGAHAILTTVVKDRGEKETLAEARCSDYKNLPSIIDSISRRISD